MSINQNQNQTQVQDNLNDAELNQNQDGATKEFNWGKLSFKLSIASVVTVALYWLALWDFHRNYPSGGIIDFKIFIFCVFATPIIAITNIICILIFGVNFTYKHKYYVISGFIISLTVLGAYGLYFL